MGEFTILIDFMFNKCIYIYDNISLIVILIFSYHQYYYIISIYQYVYVTNSDDFHQKIPSPGPAEKKGRIWGLQDFTSWWVKTVRRWVDELLWLLWLLGWDLSGFAKMEIRGYNMAADG